MVPLEWETPHTKTALALIRAIGLEGKTLVVVDRRGGTEERSFRNLPEVRIAEGRYVTPYDVLWSRNLLFCAGTWSLAGSREPTEAKPS